MLLRLIQEHARRDSFATALVGESGHCLSYGELVAQVELTISRLERLSVRTIGALGTNDHTWAVLDIAAMTMGLTLVPLPHFFSKDQIRHALTAAGVSLVISSSPSRLQEILPGWSSQEWTEDYFAVSTGIKESAHEGIAKITFTSGTTGTPKGVCLTKESIEKVVTSLIEAVEVSADDRHLCILPLAILLENIAGLYAALAVGAEVYLLPFEKLGFTGSNQMNPKELLNTINEHSITTGITSPEILQAIVKSIEEEKRPAPGSLRFLAVGSSMVSPALVDSARNLGIPVFQGYGLTEGCSVATLNTAKFSRSGSVGKPLRHVQIRTKSDEIELRGSLYSHYLGEEPSDREWYATGDLGRIDSDGFVFITGRIRNVIVSSFGRNISPEWIESQLGAARIIRRAVVYGESKPWLSAVIFSDAAEETIELEIFQINQSLPDYAQVKSWVRGDLESLDLSSHKFSARDKVLSRYRHDLEALYGIEAEPIINAAK